MIGRKGADAPEHVLERGDVAGRRAPVAVEQREGGELAHHLARLPVPERDQPEADVVDELGGDAAGGARHERSEDPVAADPDVHLDAVLDHRLDQVAGEAEAGRGDVRAHPGGGAPDGGRAAEAGRDAAGVGLVHEARGPRP